MEVRPSLSFFFLMKLLGKRSLRHRNFRLYWQGIRARWHGLLTLHDRVQQHQRHASSQNWRCAKTLPHAQEEFRNARFLPKMDRQTRRNAIPRKLEGNLRSYETPLNNLPSNWSTPELSTRTHHSATSRVASLPSMNTLSSCDQLAKKSSPAATTTKSFFVKFPRLRVDFLYNLFFLRIRICS